MKKIIYLLLFFNIFTFKVKLIAQTAEGGCTTVTVTQTPFYPIVYGSPSTKGTKHPCQIILLQPYVAKAAYQLQRKNSDGSYSDASDWQYESQGQYVFSNVETGTYRVRFILPGPIPCNIYTPGQPGNVDAYTLSGQYLGDWGALTYSPDQFSNDVLVGASYEINDYTFVDNEPDFNPLAYDEKEEVIMDATNSEFYDLWWLAIFEHGPQYNRYKSWGWHSGKFGVRSLTGFWKGFDFEPLHSYTVQFVIENSKCRHGIEDNTENIAWTQNKTFFICPEGTGCKFGIDDKDVILSPNPAGSYIQLQNFDYTVDVGYTLSILDLTGKMIKSIELKSNEVNISDLSNGLYIVNVSKKGKQLIKTKLAVMK